LNDPTRINQGAVNSAVNAWNSLQTRHSQQVTGRQKLAGEMEQTGNLALDYAFARAC